MVRFRHVGLNVFLSLAFALPVGASLSVFIVVNSLWLRPLPFAESDRIVFLVDTTSSGTADTTVFTSPDSSESWHAFEATAGQVVTTGYLAPLRPQIRLTAASSDLETLGVTSQYFSVLGIPIQGRDFQRSDDKFGSELVGIASYDLWKRVSEAGYGVIGSVLDADPRPIRIIGVAPRGFRGVRHGERTDLWIPANSVPSVAPVGAVSEDRLPLMIFGRLHYRQTMSDAKRRLIEDASDENDRRAKQLVSLVRADSVFGTSASRTAVMSGSAAYDVVAGLAFLVLFGGCTTIVSTVLVHYERRRRELSVRIALGASPRRLARDIGRDLLWPIAIGSGLALATSLTTLRVVSSLTLPGGIGLSRLDLSIDWRVMAFSLALALLALVTAAALPMMRLSRARLSGEMFGSTATPPVSSQRARSALIGIHTWATTVTLVVAVLFVHAVKTAFEKGAGFDIDHTVFVETQLAPPYAAPTQESLATAATKGSVLQDALRNMPGIRSVALGRPPLGLSASGFVITRTLETDQGLKDFRLGVISGSADLLASLGVRLLEGRFLTVADASTQPQPLVITAPLAGALWPGQEAAGRYLYQHVNGRRGQCQIVGVVQDFAYGSIVGARASGVLIGVSSLAVGGNYVLRTSQNAEMVMDNVAALVQQVAPDAPRVQITTGRRMVDADIGQVKLGAAFFAGFGTVILLLGLGSIAGLVAFVSVSRRREYGVRMVLGARRPELLLRAVTSSLVPVTCGLVIGLMTAVIGCNVLVSSLPGLSSLDAPSYGEPAVLILLAAIVSSVCGTRSLWSLQPAEV